MKNNLKRNCPDIIFDDWMFPVFEKLSIIEFDDVIVQYSSYDNCLDFWFYIGEYKFSIASFDDDPDYIVFTVHHDKELLVSDEMNIDDFLDAYKSLEMYGQE